MWPDLNDPLRSRWIKANLIGAVVSAVGSLLVYGVRQMTGAGAPDAGAAAVVLQFIIGGAVYGTCGAVVGLLTGAILQRLLPALPVVGWTALHAALGVLGGIALEALERSPDPPPTTSPVITLVLLGLISGTVFGVVIGALQALVLRRAAHGAGTWIAYSTLAYAAGYGVLSAIVGTWEPAKDIGGELVGQAQTIVLAVFVAFTMLPALERVTPRTSV